MEITEVRIKLMEDPHDKLQAFCSITLDACFVIRDLKIIQGTKGPFVAMPSRKLMDRCGKCKTKNHLRSNYCNQCGAKLQADRSDKTQEFKSQESHSSDGRVKLYADIAHPINSECREDIQSFVIEAFEKELIASQQPDYVCRYDDYGEDDFSDYLEQDETHTRLRPHLETRRAAEKVVQDPPVPQRDSEFFQTPGKSHRFDPPGAISLPEKESRQRSSDLQSSVPRHEEDFGTGIL